MIVTSMVDHGGFLSLQRLLIGGIQKIFSLPLERITIYGSVVAWDLIRYVV